ncbi:MAG: hypothetical protein J0G30_10800 [Actinomycetales bacterium]|nr:hypothetical protein [Actinomycetales bacterium]
MIALALVALLLLAGCGGTKVDAAPDATAGVKPATTSSPEPLPAVEDLTIPVGLDNDTVGALVLSRLNAWMRSGLTDDNVNRWTWHTGSNEDFIYAIVEQYSPIYEAALFTPDVEMLADLRLRQALYLEAAFNSANPDYDPERYDANLVFDHVTYLKGWGTEERTLEVFYRLVGNSDQNRVGEKFSPTLAEYEGKLASHIVFLVDAGDGTEKIEKISGGKPFPGQ